MNERSGAGGEVERALVRCRVVVEILADFFEGADQMFRMRRQPPGLCGRCNTTALTNKQLNLQFSGKTLHL